MDEEAGEFDSTVEDPWEFKEVNREGDLVWLVFSRSNGDASAFCFAPEDAVTLGLALAQAGQEPMEEGP